jgi:hypothetical protein
MMFFLAKFYSVWLKNLVFLWFSSHQISILFLKHRLIFLWDSSVAKNNGVLLYIFFL